MKKIISVLCVLLLFVFGLTACTNGVPNDNTGNDTTQDQTTDSDDKNNDDTNKGDNDMMINNILIAYFSCTNTTEGIANNIVIETKGTLYEIVPEVPYTAEDLKYYTNGRADKEQADPSARPAISGKIDNLDKYDIIFLGYPIWHGQAPKIIYTFLESYDFTGKTIIPFCTSHSSGIGSSDTNLHGLSASANWESGKRFSSGASQSEISNWVKSFNLNTNKVKTKLNITVGSKTLTATLADNSSAQALAERLKISPITVEMHDYGNFEKVGSLGFDLPRNDEQITTSAGDIILYQGNQITIYYDTNSWNFTKLGKIENITKSELLSILGQGNVAVTFSLSINKSSVSEFNLASGENGRAPTVMLNSGYEMPVLGIGTYSLTGQTCVNSVKSALSQGVRLIDTAHMYGNEREVGQAVRESGIPREDIFVITKIYPGTQFANPEQAIQESLDKLDIEYIDMMLLHHPGANDVKAYKAIEKFVEQGKIRSIGLSNWYIEEIDDFIAQIKIMPALVQNEIHPYYQEKAVVPYMHNLGIVMQAWYPFGGRGHTGAMLSDNTIVDIANAHSVTAAQVILRWHLQRGVVAIPGSSNPAHILENISVFGFELSENEMSRIAALDRNEKHDWY